MPGIGIDLGTTNSCVALYQDGRAEAIADELGNRTIPSCVAFNDLERLIGRAAKNQMSKNPENTVFDVKRLIGRTYDDPLVKENQKLWGFKVTDDNNKPSIQIKYKEKERNFCPEEISAMVLEKLKETAETYTKTNIRDVVITVPAHFNDAQRKATKDAGAIAGLNVVCTINEPTAAALAYGYNSKTNGSLLVFDFGGGTFDVTILKIGDDFLDIIASGGDANLGGEDITNRLVDYFAEKFLMEHNKDPRSDKEAVSRLRQACDEGKKFLSVSEYWNVNVKALFENIDIDNALSRAEFDDINNDIFKKTIEIVQKTLIDASMETNEIDAVLLVGGSARIPKVQTLLQELFKGNKLFKTVNQDEAIALGAATHAAYINGEDVGTKLHDITSFSLGIESNYRDMEVMIPRNTKIPARTTKILGNAEDYQENAEIQIYEGERAMTRDNNFLGTINLLDITPAPKLKTRMEICFDVDECGILHVSVKERGKKREVKVKIRGISRLTELEIEQMILEASMFAEEDKMLKKCSQEMNNLENIAYKCKSTIAKQKIKKEDKKAANKVKQKAEEIMDWLEKNKKTLIELRVLYEKRNELLELAEPLVFLEKEKIELYTAQYHF